MWWSVETDHRTSKLLKAVFHKFYLVHSSIFCLIYSYFTTKKIEGFNLNLEEHSKYRFSVVEQICIYLKYSFKTWLMFKFHTPWKYQKTFGFLVFSGVINGNICQNGVNTLRKLLAFTWSDLCETNFRFTMKFLWISCSISPFQVKNILILKNATSTEMLL